MRCKVGDLAVILPRANGLFPGQLCTVKQRSSNPNSDWIIDVIGAAKPYLGAEWGAFDRDLRPIRDSDGTDEMIRIAGRPVETVRQALEAIREAL